VLEAANAAAAQLREEALADAARIRDDAQRAADIKMTEASAEAGQFLEEAERLRNDAEEAAVRRRESAEAEAAKILELAGEVATRQHNEMVARKEALDESIDLAEKRLRNLVSGLRDLADRMEDVLTPEPSGDRTAAAGETLDEALKASVRNE